MHDFLCRNLNAHIAKNLSLDGDLLIRWHGIGGRTVSKTREYDLGVVEEFGPNVVLMQLGTNDLNTISAVETGSAIEDLCPLRYESYGVELICVCQTLYRKDASSFNKRVDLSLPPFPPPPQLPLVSCFLPFRSLRSISSLA